MKLSPVEGAGVSDEAYDGNGAGAYGEHDPGDQSWENEVVEMMIERGGKELVEEGVDGFCDDDYDEGECAATGYADSETLGYRDPEISFEGRGTVRGLVAGKG